MKLMSATKTQTPLYARAPRSPCAPPTFKLLPPRLLLEIAAMHYWQSCKGREKLDYPQQCNQQVCRFTYMSIYF